MTAHEYGNDIEKAVKFITAQFADNVRKDKSVLAHSFRVGMRLYEAGHTLPVVLGGFLHDVIEEGRATSDDIARMFGTEVADLVVVNSKDESIDDDRKRRDDAIRRAVRHSEAAAIIKAADLQDNLAHYRQTGAMEKVGRLEISLDSMAKLLPQAYDDEIFSFLRQRKTHA